MTHESPPQSPNASRGPAAGDDGALADVLDRLAQRRSGGTRYAVRREVARGSMGVILDIWDPDLGRGLAMKIVQEKDGQHGSEAHPFLLDRFVEEAQITGQLDHPGIVPVHEIGLDESGRLYFTMRLVTGQDLEKIFEAMHEGRDGWTQTRAVGAVLKVCEAVAYAHSKSVIHRDLKPANVMVGRFGEVYVMDWGLARVLGRKDRRDLRLDNAPASASIHTHRLNARALETTSALKTMDGDVVGTPAYMSPEQAHGDLQALGPATDIYAVGAILYHLLAGHSPYVPPGAKRDAISVWRRVRKEAPEPLATRAPHAPPELIAIGEKAMARDPAARYAGMQELAEDLRAYLEGRVVHAYETGPVAVLRKWVLRNKALAATFGAAALVVIGGVVVHEVVLSRKNSELVAANELIRASEQRALQSQALAEEQAFIARDRAAKVLQLSDVRHLTDLELRAESLWPADPEHVPALEAWLADASTLVGRRAQHELALTELRARAQTIAGADPTAPGAWNFASTEDRWQHDTQEELVRGLDAFALPEVGLIADVERRLVFARSVEERTVSSAEARARWTAAIASIADERASPEYRGLVIQPQIGLWPIGRDAGSGLWEFAHVQSGAPPDRDAASGELVLTNGCAIVLVLLPGRTFEMGAQSANRSAPNYDAQARVDESPQHEVELEAFFVSKYELTQDQWLRFTGENPSIYGPNSFFDGKQHSLLHPVEQVSWTECASVLGKLGLALPTEAQWEYAARAGTSTPWWTGAEKTTLEGAANLADQAAFRSGASWPSIDDWPELDDGYGVHAPVGALHPNPFGLHDVLGNVWEWCRDGYAASYDTTPRESDGERVEEGAIHRVSRGGSFLHEASYARSARRNNSPPETRANHLGVRPSRPVRR
ncbi:MAG: bifunctional serine/threonine-protein kinase/formylglycine-generating enzyme family protein [Planctomycetota bacterium]